MLVKPQTFSKTGRYPTATARAEYLERDGRAVDVATQNINDPERWASEMDKTTGQYHLRGSVVGREYVLSPSPDDAVTPARMRDFAQEWCARNFPNQEAAIVLHQDSKERVALGKAPILHAHVYVNAPDLETGRKLQLSNAKVRELHDSAQEMCRERGWSNQPEYWDEGRGRVRYLESSRSDFERRPQSERSARCQGTSRSVEKKREKLVEFERSSVARRGVGYREYGAAMSGRELDKTRIRRNLKEAAHEVGENQGVTLKEALGKRGIVLRPASGGDFKYRLEGRKLEFRGATLGPQFAKGALQVGIVAARELTKAVERDMGQDDGY